MPDRQIEYPVIWAAAQGNRDARLLVVKSFNAQLTNICAKKAEARGIAPGRVIAAVRERLGLHPTPSILDDPFDIPAVRDLLLSGLEGPEQLSGFLNEIARQESARIGAGKSSSGFSFLSNIVKRIRGN